jgi:hypothetical protein
MIVKDRNEINRGKAFAKSQSIRLEFLYLAFKEGRVKDVGRQA